MCGLSGEFFGTMGAVAMTYDMGAVVIGSVMPARTPAKRAHPGEAGGMYALVGILSQAAHRLTRELRDKGDSHHHTRVENQL